jgi:hypothetical protein
VGVRWGSGAYVLVEGQRGDAIITNATTAAAASADAPPANRGYDQREEKVRDERDSGFSGDMPQLKVGVGRTVDYCGMGRPGKYSHTVHYNLGTSIRFRTRIVVIYEKIVSPFNRCSHEAKTQVVLTH